MSAEIVPIGAKVMSDADRAHRRLRHAVEVLASDQWELADAIHEAHEAAAWDHDDRASRDIYEVVMRREGLDSMFKAYALVEFGYRPNQAHNLERVGRARSEISCAAAHEVDWSRFTPRALRPVSTGVLNQFEADDIAAALVDAQRLASTKVMQRWEETPAEFEARREQAQVSGGLVRRALTERGLIPHRPELEGADPGEIRDARLERLAEVAGTGITKLITERRRAAVVRIIVAAIARLADHPVSLAKIRQALDGRDDVMEYGGYINVSRFDAVKVAAEAREIWGEIPQTPGRVSWQGTPMSAREARYRFEHVEPFVARLYRAAEIAEFDQEFVRQAMDAVLSPIPSRRRRQQRNRAMTEGDAINLLYKRGIPTRSTAQVAAGGMSDLPYVRDIAAEHGITILDEGDEDLDDDTDDEDEDEADE